MLDFKNEKLVNTKTSYRKLLAKYTIIIPLIVLIYFNVHYLNPQSSIHPAKYIPLDITRSDPYLTIQTTHDDPLSDKIGQPDLQPDTKHLHIGSKAMVSSDVPQCSTMGKNILLQGGNAADAAVTVALCIGSINSHSSGIGGGGYITSKHKQDFITIDAREMAPLKSYKEMYGESQVYSKIGGLSIAVPGELKGLFELYKLHGSGNLSWKQLIDPVIKLNKQGWRCSKLFEIIIAKENELVFEKVPVLKNLWKGFLINPSDGNCIKEGDHITRFNYANTLEMIANNGSSDIFYDPNGPIVTSLIKSIHQWGGILTPEDFENYHVNIETPLSSKINDNYTIYTSNGVSSGLTLLGGLKFFNRIYNNTTDDDILFDHKLIESFKWLSSIRTRLGDVKDKHKQDNIEKYLNDEWIDDILKQEKYSDLHTFNWTNYDPQYDMVDPQGTSHFAIVDEDDNAVSMTTTVNLLFGSLIYDPTTGIILNDQMDDFALPNQKNAFNLTPSIYNFIFPGKRPLSSTAPTIITRNNKTDLVIGAAGGSRITSAILQAIIRIYYKNFSLLNTISYPRLHHQLIPESIMSENLTIWTMETENVLRKLAEKNHTFIETGSLTAMNGIKRVENGLLHGVSDYWRKRGEADGY